MNLIFNKKLIARNIALALAIGVITTGCAGNSPQQTQTSKVEKMPVEQTVATAESKTIAKTKLAENNSDVVNAAIVEDKIETNSSAAIIPYPDIDISENTKPDQLNFQFGFDKAELSEDDANTLKQHAKFLIDNPETVLNINGHTDHHGAKIYNEYLSKKRADTVAKILIESGVSESQIKISALANSEPLLDVDNTRMNRRVELKYTEMNMVSAE